MPEHDGRPALADKCLQNNLGTAQEVPKPGRRATEETPIEAKQNEGQKGITGISVPFSAVTHDASTNSTSSQCVRRTGRFQRGTAVCSGDVFKFNHPLEILRDNPHRLFQEPQSAR